MRNWREVVVSREVPLSEAVAKIDASGLQVALVLDAQDQLEGILTDGNIRRALLAGKGLDVPVSEVMTSDPMSVPDSTPEEDMLGLMRRQTIHHLPLVGSDGRVTGLRTIDHLIGAVERPNWVVLMAGGLGTRLRPLTDSRPKPLLPVGGTPILETIVRSFAEQGFKRVFISVNYKSEMIREHFGDGDRWGMDVEYLSEDTRLGTAGALSLLAERPSVPLVVMNGDLLTRANFNALLQFHHAHGATATMAVREYDVQVPYGVVRLEGEKICNIDEKPVHKFFVNAGIYVLAPEALDHVSPGEYLDMPSLFERLIQAGETTMAYPLREYWLDIGRLEELERAQLEWTEALSTSTTPSS